jgi:hypothetical protein
MVRRKKLLALHPLPGYFVHRSNTVTDRAVCFLGRFLPKLGGASAPPSFFCGFADPRRIVQPIDRPRSRLSGPGLLPGPARDLDGQSFDQEAYVALDVSECRRPLEASLVHIKVACDFDLERVHLLPRPAIVARDKASGIGIIAANAISEIDQPPLYEPGDMRGAGGAMGIAQYNIGQSLAATGNGDVGRHGMAIDQHALPEHRARSADQRGHHVMKRLPACLDSPLSLREGQFAAVDRLAGGDDSRDRAKSRGNTGAGGVNPGGQVVSEHARIELPLFAIGIAPRTRERRVDQRCAKADCRGEQFVHETVLAAPQAKRVKAGGREEFWRVAAS